MFSKIRFDDSSVITRKISKTQLTLIHDGYGAVEVEQVLLRAVIEHIRVETVRECSILL